VEADANCRHSICQIFCDEQALSVPGQAMREKFCARQMAIALFGMFPEHLVSKRDCLMASVPD
jgi:hypothetical protein